MVRHKLTDAKIKGAKLPCVMSDGGGLYIRVHAGGSKSWFFIYRRNGQRRELGLGGFAGTAPVSLAKAREKADAFRQILADDRDPYAERLAAKAQRVTFGDLAETYMREKNEWTAHTEREWRRHLLEHSAKLKTVAVASINTELVEATLRPLWDTKPATGQRVRGKIESVLDYATAKKLRVGDNPARWSGHLEHILKAASRVTGDNHAALSYNGVAAFLRALDATTAAQCLRFVILTACRSGEHERRNGLK
ncbi:tyrosine-type recombinase/integrase [Mesorhizobium sp. A623]